MLSKFPNSTLKVGAVISLAPESTTMNTAHNPRGVRGVVVDTDIFDMIQVKWGDDITNIYAKTRYDLIAEGEPGFLATE